MELLGMLEFEQYTSITVHIREWSRTLLAKKGKKIKLPAFFFQYFICLLTELLQVITFFRFWHSSDCEQWARISSQCLAECLLPPVDLLRVPTLFQDIKMRLRKKKTSRFISESTVDKIWFYSTNCMPFLALILSLANLPAPLFFQLVSLLCTCQQYPWAIQNAPEFTKAAHDY